MDRANHFWPKDHKWPKTALLVSREIDTAALALDLR